MDDNPEQRFRQTVRNGLAYIQSDLIVILHQLASHDYPESVHAIDFEIFSDSFTSQFPARAFFMDKFNCEYFIDVDGKASYPSPVDPELLTTGAIYPDELEDTILATSPDLDLWNAATEEFIPWFYHCWNEAGGKSLALAATLAHHDSRHEFNLQSGQWQPRGASFGP